MKSYYCDITYDNTCHEWSYYCGSPITALNEFHRRAQLNQFVGSDRKITKRKLRHDEYKIDRLWADGGEYDMPRSTNPDLRKPIDTTPPIVTSEFDGMPQPGVGGLAP